MRCHSERARLLVLGALILLLVNGPYLAAYGLSDPPRFGGILFALQDGYSYLAKMRAGWRGEWLFTLPYTAEPGAGAALMTYYLFLGHLARWTGASLDLIYHLARVVNGGLFLGAAYAVLGRVEPEPGARRRLWLIFVLSGGLGWLALPWLSLPPDFWIAESIPFLTLISNAHFPLMWALLLATLTLTAPGLAPEGLSARRLAAAGALTLLLGLVQPMALAPLGVTLVGATAWQVWEHRTNPVRAWLPVLVVGVCAAPWVLNAWWAVQTLPVLRAWNAQNLTPSPPLAQAVVWGGLPLLAALPGLWVAARRRTALDRLCVSWLVLGVLLLYAPLALQRRLAVGLWLPLCALAWIGWREVLAPWFAGRRRPLALAGVLALGLSNGFVWAALLAGVLTRTPDYFFTRDEAAALDWLAAQAGRPVVLAGPELSLAIPARSDARVIYGHDFETVNAAEQKAAVLAFYAGGQPAQPFLDEQGVDLVLVGPRERALGPEPDLADWRRVFEQGTVAVYGR